MVIHYDGDHDLINSEHFSTGRSIIEFEDDDRLMPKIVVFWQTDGSDAESYAEIVDPDLGFEGAPKIVSHVTRERRSTYAKLKKALVLAKTGALACEACSFDFLTTYGEIGREFCEVHHNEPLACGERITSLDDLSIVCANCHRIIHRSAGVVGDGVMLSVRELRKVFEPQPRFPRGA